jgi:hypothetical protein
MYKPQILINTVIISLICFLPLFYINFIIIQLGVVFISERANEQIVSSQSIFISSLAAKCLRRNWPIVAKIFYVCGKRSLGQLVIHCNYLHDDKMTINACCLGVQFSNLWICAHGVLVPNHAALILLQSSPFIPNWMVHFDKIRAPTPRIPRVYFSVITKHKAV